MAATPNIMVSASIDALAGNQTNNTIAGSLSLGGGLTVEGAVTAGSVSTTSVSTTSVSATTAAVSGVLTVGVYTRANKPATGAVGQVIAISNSSGSTSQTIDGLLAYWDVTDTRWSYIHDNKAV